MVHVPASRRQEAKDRAYHATDALIKQSAMLHCYACHVLDAAITGKDPRYAYITLGSLLRDIRQTIYTEAVNSDTDRGTPASSSDESLVAAFLSAMKS